jgi:predicted O-methyltransferase YrrM
MEIGTWRGCSATHILYAMEANGCGQLISVDMQRHTDGIDIPKELLHRWTFVEEEGTAFITRERPKVGLVFEDASHTFPVTVALLTAIDYFIKPAVVVSHDAFHPAHRESVNGAWDLVYKKDYDRALIAPSDCGLAWKVYP